eukprot:5071879-Alexandrium_andersonii.AAC.1
MPQACGEDCAICALSSHVPRHACSPKGERRGEESIGEERRGMGWNGMEWNGIERGARTRARVHPHARTLLFCTSTALRAYERRHASSLAHGACVHALSPVRSWEGRGR